MGDDPQSKADREARRRAARSSRVDPDPPTNPIQRTPAESARRRAERSIAEDETSLVSFDDELTELSSISDAEGTNPYHDELDDEPTHLASISDAQLDRAVARHRDETVFPKRMPPGVRGQKSFPTPIPGHLQPPPRPPTGYGQAGQSQQPVQPRRGASPAHFDQPSAAARSDRLPPEPRDHRSPWEQPDPPPPVAPPASDDGPKFRLTPAQKKIVSMATPVLLAIGCAWLMLLSAVAKWAPPGDVLVWAIGGTIPLTIAITFGVAIPKDRMPRFGDVRLTFLPLAGGCALLLATALVWQIGAMRGMLRGWAPDTPEVAAKVMRDRSLGVAVDECVRLAPQTTDGEMRSALLDGLSQRPALVAKCLDRVDESARTTIAATLIDRWRSVLLDPDASSEKSCAIARATTALPRTDVEIRARLLECVARAPAQATSECCASALGAGATEWVEGLDPTKDYSPADETSVALMSLAFDGIGPTKEQRNLARKAGFEGVEAQRMAVAFSCESLRNGGSTVASHLRASLHSRCDVDVSKLPEGADFWQRVCKAGEARLLRRRQNPSTVLCDAAKESANGRR